MFKLLIISLVLLLASCGGGGGGGSSNSSSSETAATSSDPCNSANGIIFSECMNTFYGALSGGSFFPKWEWYENSASTNQIQWAVVDSGDTNYKNVIDISFLDNEKRALFLIGKGEQVKDMSAYQTGTISFDIRVLNWGDAFDSTKNGLVLTFRPECKWPCASHEAEVILPSLNAWSHVDLSIKDMIKSGMDISKLDNLLTFTTLSANQKGLHFQIDNLQYKKGAGSLPAQKILYKEDFNSADLSNWKVTSDFGSASVQVFADVGPWLIFNWNGFNQTIRWETVLSSSIDVTNKTASFQIKCDPGTNMNFGITMIATDTSGVVAETPSAAMGADLPANVWAEMSLSVGDQFYPGFHPKSVNKIGLKFSNYSSVMTVCRIDTVRIVQ